MYVPLEIGWVIVLWLLMALGVMLICTGMVKLFRSWFSSLTPDAPATWKGTSTGLFDGQKRYRFILNTGIDRKDRQTEVDGIRIIARKKADEFTNYGGMWILIGQYETGEKIYLPSAAIVYFEETKKSPSHA